MTYIPGGSGTNNSITSADGVNSANQTKLTGAAWVNDGLWATASIGASQVWTGASEQNNYGYAGVNLQVDETGTLTFQFSQDGTNWSSYPVTQFAISSGINEVHGAWKGTRYIRVVYTSSANIGTYFRMRTMYSNSPVTLIAPLNQSIVTDQDASVTRAILTGQEPDGTFMAQKTDGIAFSTKIALTTAGVGLVYTSSIASTEGYSQIETHLYSDVSGILVGSWYDDAIETTLLRTFTRPYANDKVGAISYFSAPIFGPYIKYIYTSDTDQTAFFLNVDFRTKAISGQILGVNDFIPDSVVANLGRNVVVGQQPNGTFLNDPSDGQGFSTSTPLAAGANIESGWIDLHGLV